MTDTALVGATLVDGTGSPPLPDSAVVVSDGWITWVGAASDLDFTHDLRLVNVADKYLIPGLMDANVHLVLQCEPDILLRYEPGCYDELAIEAAQVALKAGITTLFDTWGPLETLRRVRDRINTGEVTGSRIFFAGNIIGNGGPWSADFFPYGERLNPAVAENVNKHWEQGVGANLTWMSSDDVRHAVREYITTSGIDFVKYASSSHAHSRFIALSPHAQRALVEEAHAAGMTVQACAMTPEALKLTIEAGVDLLQHGNSTGRYPIPDETLDLIVARRLPCVLFLHTERCSAAVRGDTQLPSHWRQSFLGKEANARNLVKAGAKLLHATDGGVFGPTVTASPWLGALFRLPDVPLRLGSSHVFWHQAVIERGMEPMDALLAATRNIAQAYHKEDELGTIAPGKRADLLVLDANPLDDPRNYGRIAHVVKDGEIVDRARLPQHPVLTHDASRTSTEPSRPEKRFFAWMRHAQLDFAAIGEERVSTACWPRWRRASARDPHAGRVRGTGSSCARRATLASSVWPRARERSVPPLRGRWRLTPSTVMRRSGLSPAQQAFALHARFPDAKGTLKAGRLVWTGMLRPTPLSRSYWVEISYGQRGEPRVRVLETLATREGQSLPHVYTDGTLCLHEPGEWTDSMCIADTTVAWTAEWLANYEIWLATGDWHGGGEWPPRRSGSTDVVAEREVKSPPTEAARHAPISVTDPTFERARVPTPHDALSTQRLTSYVF